MRILPSTSSVFQISTSFYGRKDMEMRQEVPLGPQCLRCKRRRIKCDSAPDMCQRCGRDGYDCPGYEKKTTWIQYTQTGMKQSRKRRRTSGCPRQDGSNTAGAIISQTSASLAPSSKQSVGSLVMPPSLILSTIEKEILEVQSCVIYYNETLVPDLAASPIPSQSMSIQMDLWLQKSPKVLHHIIVTIVMCQRLACTGSAHGMPSGKEESQLGDTLNRHRSRGLMHLRRMLSDFWHGDGNHAISDEQRKTNGLITLAAVIMLLTQEVQMSATSLWSMHLEAARSLMVHLGGIETIWSLAPLHRSLLILYMVIDMVSPPTSPSWSINEVQQRTYLETIGRLEDFGRTCVASVQPCPLPILTAVVQTNIMRAETYKYQTNPDLPDPDFESLSQTAALTIASLLRFDPAAWSHKVCTDYLSLPLPQRRNDSYGAAWTALATSYQAAAIIYLLRSTQQTLVTDIAGQDAESLLADQRWRLDTALTFLCRDLSRVRASGLWRFVGWASFVYAYELAGWTELTTAVSTISPEGGNEDDEALLAMSGPQAPPKNVVAALQRLQR